MRFLRTLFLTITLGGAALGAIAVIFIDPPTPERAIEAPANLPPVQ